jgi:cytochrome c oxidase subunit 2
VLLPEWVQAHGASMAKVAARERSVLVKGVRVTAVGVWLVLAAFAFASCGGDDEAATPTDPVLAQGQQVYRANCASCHGVGGGGGLAPKIGDGIVASRYPDIADQEAVIVNGLGTMPGFGERLSADEVTAVARYEREFLGQ